MVKDKIIIEFELGTSNIWITDKAEGALPAEPVIYPDPEIERDVYVPQMPLFPPKLAGSDRLNSFDDPKQLFDLINSMQQNGGQPSPGASNFFAFSQFGNLDGSAGPNPFFANMNQSPKVPETRLKKALDTKLHIGLLAVATYLLITMSSFHWNAFLIFLVWEIAEIFIVRQHESNPNGIVNILLMLVGISSTKLNIVLKWIQLLNKVLRDVALFMFFFVLSHFVHVYLLGLSLVPLTENADPSPNVVYTDDAATNDEFERFDL